CAPIQTDPDRGGARAARAYQVRREDDLVRKLIKQTGFFRKKIVEHERVAVAYDQQWAVRIGIYCRARFFVADRSDRDFFRLGLLCIRSGKIAKIAFDRGLFPFRCVIFPRLAGEFLVNFLLDRLCRDNATKSRPMRIGLAKNWGVLAGTVLEENWRKIDYVNSASAQFVIKSRKEWSRRFTVKIDIGHNFLRMNCCLRRDRH